MPIVLVLTLISYLKTNKALYLKEEEIKQTLNGSHINNQIKWKIRTKIKWKIRT